MLISEITTVNKNKIILEKSAIDLLSSLSSSRTFDLMSIVSVFGTKYFTSLSNLKREYNETLRKNNCSLKIQKKDVKFTSTTYSAQISNVKDNQSELISYQHQTNLIKILDKFRDEFIEGLTTLLLGVTVGKSVGKASGNILSIITTMIPGIGPILGPMISGLSKIPGISALSGTFVLQKFTNLIKDTEFVESFKNYMMSKYITHNYFQKTAPCNQGKIENLNIDPLKEEFLTNAEQNLRKAVINFMKKDKDLRKVLGKSKI